MIHGNILPKLFILLTMLLYSSCQKKQEAASEIDYSIIGSWTHRESCIYVGIGTYSLTNLTYNQDQTFSQQSRSFSNSTCTSPTVVQTITGTYLVTPNTELSATAVNFFNLDSTLVSWVITPTSPSIAASLNSANFCGLSNWAANTPQNIEGRTCSGLTMPSVGQVEYSFYGIMNQDLPQMGPIDPSFAGDMTMGTTAGTSNDGTTALLRHRVQDGNSFIRN